MSITIGKDGKKTVKEIYVGVGGQVRKVTKGYVGVGGVPKLFYSSAPAPLPVYTVSTFVDPPESGTATGAGQYAKGDTVTLKATANDGYVFSGWWEADGSHDPLSKNAVYTFTANKDVSLIAVFEKSPSRLPFGHTEVQYIQSSGTQYINTGIVPTNTTTINVDVQPTSAGTSTAKYIWSSYATVGSYAYRFDATFSSSGVQVIFGRTSGAISGITKTLSSSSTARRMVLRLDAAEKTAKLDGDTQVSFSNNTLSSSMPSITLLSSSSFTTSNMVSGRLYSCSIYSSGSIIMEFVPCKNPSGEVGLYDLVGGKFYGNSGSGSFSAGPSV